MPAKPLMIAASVLSLSLAASAAFASFAQQGAKLVGSGAAGSSDQGYGVAVSADGNTAIVGGYGDNATTGAAWVFTRSGGVWSPQGGKLVGTGAVGAAAQGISVAISADGNTAAVGGYLDNGGVGAVWVYTRTAGLWSQQGAKLVGTGATGSAHQGWSVALSGDGNTVLVGGYSDNGLVGAVWVFTRSAGVWSQQGAKLVGTGGVGSPQQGISVALSADGTTAMVGGYLDNASTGAAWVYTRSGTVWSQQGPKLIGTGAVGGASQGISVALSADGNTAMVGGFLDNANTGAAWMFTRSGSVWTQQGAKLVGTGAVGGASQGGSVSLAADGNTAIAGGTGDNFNVGAAWIFRRGGGVWTQLGSKLVGTGASGTPRQGAVAISGDGNTAVVGGSNDNGNLGAAWVFVKASPTLVSVRDVPNDQGGWVNLRWTAGLLDNAPADPIDAYWIWRQVPTGMALDALAAGATLVNGRDTRPTTADHAFRMTANGAQIYYWEFVGSQVAHGFPAYSFTAPTTADSVPGSNPYTVFMVEAERLSTGEYWASDPDSGYSVDDLPPGPPAPVAAVYEGGATHLHWPRGAEPDLAGYRVYRGASAGFVPGAGNLIASPPDTGYADIGAAGAYYKLSALDVHGNESAFALVTPAQTTGVDPDREPAFALEGVRPNPSRGEGFRVEFALPGGAPARLEVFDAGGRRLSSREVGSLGAGRHTVDPVEGRRFAPGVYWVRLSQGAMRRETRVAVIE